MSRPTLRSSLTSALRTFSSSSRVFAPAPGASSRPLTDLMRSPSTSASTSSGSASGPASTANPMDSPDYRRLMERSLSMQGEEERRKRFMTKTIIKPTELTTTALHAKRPPRVRPALLGPRQSVAKAQDPFYITRTNPIDHALNPNFVLSFVNPLGRIKKRQETGLTRRTQRKVDKMVKRARGMGVIPVFTNVGSADGIGRRRL